jgi:hypothetical protein
MNIATTLEEILHDWNVEPTAIVTDNASSMCSCARQFSSSFHVPCAAHTLQLAVNSGLKIQAIENVLEKCRKLVGHFKHSTKDIGILNEIQLQESLNTKIKKPLKLVQDVSTRWNSTFFMLNRIKKLKLPLKRFLVEKDYPWILTNTEWNLIDDLGGLLEKFKEVTEIISAEKYPTLSILFPCIELMKAHLRNYVPKTRKVKSVQQEIKKEISTRWSYKSKEMEPALIATALDPRYKNLDFVSKEKVKEMIWKLVEQEFYALENDVHPEETIPQKKKPKLSILALFTKENNQDELMRYKKEQQIKEEEDPLEWWRKNKRSYKVLARLARQYLAIPATSAPSERLFSSAGNVISKLRSSLDPETASMLIVLHENSKEKTFSKRSSKRSKEEVEVITDDSEEESELQFIFQSQDSDYE